MLTRRCSMAKNGRATPLPISEVIQVANLFGCDIYIRNKRKKVNVKNYEEFKSGIQPQRTGLIFYFEGDDEKEADVKFRVMFGI